ncbi:MAG: RsmD family RNA methyltransferase, partial [Acidimicrobiales bacterium]
ARAALETNLATTGLAELATVVAGPVDRFLKGVGGRRWDLALIDPPYQHDHEAWLILLDQLPADLAVLESDRPVDPPFGWEVLRSKRYGSTHVVIAERRPV